MTFTAVYILCLISSDRKCDKFDSNSSRILDRTKTLIYGQSYSIELILSLVFVLGVHIIVYLQACVGAQHHL